MTFANLYHIENSSFDTTIRFYPINSNQNSYYDFTKLSVSEAKTTCQKLYQEAVYSHKYKRVYNQHIHITVET